MRTEYIIETFYLGKWLRVLSASRDYCRGYISARKDYAPRNAYRIVRNGKIIEEISAVESSGSSSFPSPDGQTLTPAPYQTEKPITGSPRPAPLESRLLSANYSAPGGSGQ